jgi:hypothetical protein
MAVNSYGLPIEFQSTGGAELHDSQAAPTLLDRLPNTDYIMADEATIVKHLERKYAKKYHFSYP